VHRGGTWRVTRSSPRVLDIMQESSRARPSRHTAHTGYATSSAVVRGKRARGPEGRGGESRGKKWGQGKHRDVTVGESDITESPRARGGRACLTQTLLTASLCRHNPLLYCTDEHNTVQQSTVLYRTRAGEARTGSTGREQLWVGGTQALRQAVIPPGGGAAPAGRAVSPSHIVTPLSLSLLPLPSPSLVLCDSCSSFSSPPLALCSSKKDHQLRSCLRTTMAA